ncbi:DNA polymerase I [Leptolyngbya sp. Cla-17]|uniref:DNA polymerase I n=1 Tax=Leptolyngbya sp. Cla-17 TaxID=2803751 RepID=UPI0018D7DE06|nr:DNA polymerase I [Leptolyngbya sp. Cla-17]
MTAPLSASIKPILVLVDGHSLAFRSYYAHAKGREGGLRTKSGIPTSVSYGFLKALLEVMETEKPQYVAIAFDVADKTFRHDQDDTYKAGRPDAPEDFLPDLKNLQELLAALKLPVLTAPGYEADDIIGTLTRRATAEGMRVKILSGDRDLFQLVNPEDSTTVLYMSTSYGKGIPSLKEFGSEEVKAKLGVLPGQVVDFKALCGDSSDNIPGVRGIGEKTAVQLLKEYDSLHGVYAAIDQIKGATRKKLEDGRNDALHSQYLAQIHLDVPIDVDLETCQLQEFDDNVVLPLLEKLEFRTFLSKLQKLHRQFGGETEDVLEAEENAIAAEPLQALSNNSFDGGGDLWFFSAEETEAAVPIQSITLQPHVIDTPEKLYELVEVLEVRNQPDLLTSWDTETTALEPRDSELVGIGIGWGEAISDVAYIPLNHTSGANLDKALVLETLRPILESPDYPKALQNAKFDRLILRQQGIQLAGVAFDTMLASYVINPDQKHNLSDLTLTHLGLTTTGYTDLVPKGKTIADISIPAVAQYCGMDAHTVFRLVPILRLLLIENSALHRLFVEVEMPVEPVLAEMEWLGVRINQEYLHEFSKQLEQDLARIEQQAYKVASSSFNLGSPKQLSELLFETLQLDRRKSRKTKTGYSTDGVTLEKLLDDHPVIETIVEHRTLSKLKSTYVDALPAIARKDTQRVHTNFNQAIAVTGRLSSSDPNLQNIPIRTAFSRLIRQAFIPEPGWLMVSADYSQIELRILAHLSQEPVLLETYQNKQDIHTLTAQLLFEKEGITSDERRLGKIINFGVIYGMGAQRFAREAKVDRRTAQEFIDRFNSRYSNVFKYLQRMQQEAIANGYVVTILGRRRYFNFTSENLRSLRGHDPSAIDLSKLKLRDQYDAQMLRAAANAPIQGSSADIIKIAMIRLHELLKDHDANLLLQVHDELIFEMRPEEWSALQPKIQSMMESAVTLSVPLAVEIHAGDNWMDAK